ncbi:MAG: glucose-1-phosphate thymidylyltransferase [Cyclobacteriaceae bacterium]|nr:glucose-1-phosphate thymidylyltransferase [Cyclobacteriaceae bacterium]
MNIILFDLPATKTNLLPFTFTRPVADIRIGILSIKEKWERHLQGDYSYLTADYLAVKFPAQKSSKNIYLNGAVLPNAQLVAAVKALGEKQILVKDALPIAFFGNLDSVDELESMATSEKLEQVHYPSACISIDQVYHIFALNGAIIRSDYELLTHGRKSQPVGDEHTICYNSRDIFIEENVQIRAAILNAETGPIYIGKNAEIAEGSIVRGATAICESSILNLGTRIRGDATIGPFCKVGGEISNSVIFGYSSKAHDGYLGNSVIGEWCNLGADTNTSNLKNNYKNVKLWHYGQERFVDTGRQFCGLMMGDHSKCGINTMFNTGTVVGVSANIFGSGFPRTFIPSFSWGGANGLVTYQFKQALEVMPKVFERRKKTLTEADVELLKHIFDATEKYRRA